MNRVLATTDLSRNSRAGLRFAINMAQQKKAELIFIYIHQVLRASTWSDERYEQFVSEDKENMMRELTRFVADVYKQMGVEQKNCKCEVYHDFGVVHAVNKYAVDNDCDYICIATRGAGTVKKLFGTITAKLIKEADVPVICVPKNYRVKLLAKVLYATDMTNYEDEVARVLSFAKPLKAEVEMMHMTFPYELLIDKELAEKDLKKKFRYNITMHYETRYLERTLLEDLEQAVKKAKPSIVAMFTDRSRSFFDRILMGSMSEEFSFSTRIPLLIFKKA